MKRWSFSLSFLFLTVALAGCRENARNADILGARVAATGAPTEFTRSFGMPVRAMTFANVSGCDNSPGPYITLEGEIALGGLGSRLIFRNNDKGTHEYTDESHTDLVVVPAGDRVVLPKQPVQGGVGGNPFIWIKFEDDRGAALSDEIYLGRCVQGFRKDVTANYPALAAALARLSVADCANSPGPTITLDGNLTLRSGLDAKLIFRNNDNPVGGPHEAGADAVVRVRLLPPGHVIQFPKQPSRGGVGGNPWIWFGFLDGAGAPLHEPELLGRCEQLSKA